MKSPSAVVALLLAASTMNLSEASHIEQKTNVGQKTVIHLSLIQESEINRQATHKFAKDGDEDTSSQGVNKLTGKPDRLP